MVVGVLTGCVSLAIGGVSAPQGGVKPLGCKTDVGGLGWSWYQQRVSTRWDSCEHLLAFQASLNSDVPFSFVIDLVPYLSKGVLYSGDPIDWC